MLVLLAASPVTAPFSSCDLRLFTAGTAIIEPAFAQFGAMSGVENASGDAYSLSPLDSRSVLPPDSSASVSIPAVRVARSAQMVWTTAPRDRHRCPHDPSASMIVLRV
jgi:hypothetical protein